MDQDTDQINEMSLHPVEPVDPEQLPDLPELESVEAKTEDARPITAVLAAIGLLLVVFVSVASLWALISEWDLMGDTVGGATILGAMVVMILLFDYWVFSRLARHERGWKTSEQGLLIRKLFRKRLVRWDDVTGAEIVLKRLKEPRLKLSTVRSKVLLSPGASRNLVLYLSIWQHLRRRDKASGLPFPPQGMWLWHRPPEDIPEEMDWQNPEPPTLLEPAIRFALWNVLLFTVAWHFTTRDFQPLPLACGLSASMLGGLLRRFTFVRAFSLHKDRFEARTMQGFVSSTWKDVKSMDFVGGLGDTPPSVVLKLGSTRSVCVPWHPRHPNSTKLVLAILQRLREEADLGPIPIPTILLVAMNDGGAAFWNAR